MSDGNSVRVMGEHVLHLHHAGRAAGGNDGSSARDDIVALALANLLREIVMIERERTAAAAAGEVGRHVHSHVIVAEHLGQASAIST